MANVDRTCSRLTSEAIHNVRCSITDGILTVLKTPEGTQNRRECLDLLLDASERITVVWNKLGCLIQAEIIEEAKHAEEGEG